MGSSPVDVLRAPGEYLCGLTWDGRHLWHSDQGALEIYALDPANGAIRRRFGCASVRADLAFDGSSLCQIGDRPKRLVVVDPDTGAVTGHRPIDPANGRVTGAEFGPEGLWLVLRDPTVVQLRNAATMTVEQEYPVPGASPSGLTYVDGLVVFGDFEAATLHAIEADTGRHVGAMPVRGHPTGMTWDGQRLWYCDFPGRVLRAIVHDRTAWRARQSRVGAET